MDRVQFLRSHLPKVIARDEALLAEVGQLGGGDDPVQLVGVAPVTQDTRTPLGR
ncbi:hypothetical protein OKW40_007338 [Paraburkholderia sp. RAU6.4a]